LKAAALNGHFDIVEFLRSQEAEIDDRHACETCYDSAVQIALHCGHYGLASLFLENGDETHTVDPNETMANLPKAICDELKRAKFLLGKGAGGTSTHLSGAEDDIREF
jgi:hypothetical protein